MMYKSNAFGYVTIMIILTLNMAANDGEMLFYYGDSNLYIFSLLHMYCIFLLFKMVFITAILKLFQTT